MAATRVKSQDVFDGAVGTADLADGGVTFAKLSVATDAGIEDAGSGAIQVKLVSTGGLAKGSTGVYGRGFQVLAADPSGAGLADGDSWFNSTNKSVRFSPGDAFEQGVVSCFFTDAAGSTVISNSAAESNISQLFTLPVNALRAGRWFRARWWGRYTAAAGATITFRGYLGNTLVVDPGASDPPDVAGTSKGFFVQFDFFVASSGTAGSVLGTLSHGFQALTGGALGLPVPTAGTTVNTTLTRDLKLTVQFSAASTNNTCFTSLATMELLNP
jgi:hypothetical protein